MSKPLTPHQQRVKDELAKAGMTSYGQHKLASRYLPSIIDNDEHIEAVVYGHAGVGLAMLIATNLRILYVEKRPLFTSTDELSYEVVVGIRHIKAGLFPAVELHTRMGNYTLTYVNPKCASNFTKYIERRIEGLTLSHSDESPATAGQLSEAPPMPVAPKKVFSDQARDFLSSQEIAVLSTTDRTGNVEGATVYYLFGSNNKLYILTKSDTAKAHNMLANHQVALTVFDAETARTAQIQGYAEIEADPATKRTVFDYLIKPRTYAGKTRMPPLTELDAGGFIAFRITPTNVKYSDYQSDDRLASANPRR